MNPPNALNDKQKAIIRRMFSEGSSIEAMKGKTYCKSEKTIQGYIDTLPKHYGKSQADMAMDKYLRGRW